jgi:hypothetical protein
MSLIYIYSLDFSLLGQFYAANGYGIDQVGGGLFVAPGSLPKEVQTPFVMKQKKVIVKRMNFS